MNRLNGDREPLDMPCLSAHEMAALMLLDHAPVAVEMGTLDIVALRESGLAELIDPGLGESRFSITRKGREVLRILSALIEQEGDFRVA
jgi:hypothetical protein